MAREAELDHLDSSCDNGHDRTSTASARAPSDTFDLVPIEPVNSATARRHERWRRILGLCLLFTTVILWTASNFLASTLFADDTYSKPFLVTYVNTAFFIIPLIPMLIRQAYHDPRSIPAYFSNFRRHAISSYSPIGQRPSQDQEAFLKPDSPRLYARPRPAYDNDPLTDSHTTLLAPPAQPGAPSIRSILTASSPSRLTLSQTARLSLEFCLLWFLANYFVAACLEYTTVASSTILTSTSSVFTLLFGTLFKVETFSIRKLLGVLFSLAGIILISSVDLSGSSDENRGTFPHKTIREVAVGDVLALISAVLYGMYAVFMKKRIRDETRVFMPLFFGLVGVCNVLFLWPGFLLLHYFNIERFELPPTGTVTLIILINSASSLVSDFAWAYAVLLTSPIVVTVGLSTTIPLSLIGQLLLNGQSASILYWVGALIVLASFVIVNQDESVEDSHGGVEADLALAPGEIVPLESDIHDDDDGVGVGEAPTSAGGRDANNPPSSEHERAANHDYDNRDQSGSSQQQA